jgi:hypothetical protein
MRGSRVTPNGAAGPLDGQDMVGRVIGTAHGAVPAEADAMPLLPGGSARKVLQRPSGGTVPSVPSRASLTA